jgi:RHS repeat-associated protein
VIAGGNNGGKSHISYTPYGSIHRTDSSGPDITRFKFTGQEEDKDSGLMYYKARYYDPMIGRFLQADSVVMPESTFGMNRYMYVEGSPVNYRDPDGHKRVAGDQQRQIYYLAAAVYGFDQDKENPYRGALIAALAVPRPKHEEKMVRGDGRYHKKYNEGNTARDVSRGYKRIVHDFNHFNNGALSGGIKWASHGLQRAADTYNLLLFGKHHNENTIWHKTRNGDIGRAYTRNKACADFALGFGGKIPIGKAKGGLGPAAQTFVIESGNAVAAEVITDIEIFTAFAVTWEIIIIAVGVASVINSASECAKSINHL